MIYLKISNHLNTEYLKTIIKKLEIQIGKEMDRFDEKYVIRKMKKKKYETYQIDY